MRLRTMASATRDWVGYALTRANAHCVCSVAVSFEHWSIKCVDRLLYAGPSTSGKTWVLILGWFIFAVPRVPMAPKRRRCGCTAGTCICEINELLASVRDK